MGLGALSAVVLALVLKGLPRTESEVRAIAPARLIDWAEAHVPRAWLEAARSRPREAVILALAVVGTGALALVGGAAGVVALWRRRREGPRSREEMDREWAQIQAMLRSKAQDRDRSL
jgi:hypothetical protein